MPNKFMFVDYPLENCIKYLSYSLKLAISLWIIGSEEFMLKKQMRSRNLKYFILEVCSVV
jgi:hypothetical protein